MFARHGFHNVAERIKLGRFVLEKISTSAEMENLSVAQRIRMSFEELGPTYVKLGQVLAARPDLVPESFIVEFEKLHASVQPLSFETVEHVLKQEFGDDLYKLFSRFDPQPLGSASIAQVHRAWLGDGSEVVVKVQRPGIVDVINDDLSVLYFLAELLDQYVEEARPFNPMGIVDEFFKTLELETNFLVEANNIRRFSENFKNDADIVIPKVYLQLSTERVLVLEALKGIPLSSERALQQEGIDPDRVIRIGLRCYLKMVFTDGLFHGDLHAGNFFILPDNRIGLIDFGVVGRLNSKTQSAIANMMIALATEDYEKLANEYVDLAPFNERTNTDIFARELRDLLAPFYGLTLKNVNLGKILMGSAGIASRNQVTVPTELMLFFKSIVTIEGLARKIIRDFDFLSYSLEFAQELAKTQYNPEKLVTDTLGLLQDSKSLIYALPRQLKHFLRRINSPDFAVKIKVDGLAEMRESQKKSYELVYWGLIIAALILASAITNGQPSPSTVLGMNPLSFVGFCLSAVFGAWAYFRR